MLRLINFNIHSYGMHIWLGNYHKNDLKPIIDKIFEMFTLSIGLANSLQAINYKLEFLKNKLFFYYFLNKDYSQIYNEIEEISNKFNKQFFLTKTKHLIEELLQVKRDRLDDDTKLYLQPKKGVRENLKRSPDFSDAMMMRMLAELKNNKIVPIRLPY